MQSTSHVEVSLHLAIEYLIQQNKGPPKVAQYTNLHIVQNYIYNRSIVSYQLPAAYIIAKLSADSILDNNQKTPIVCGKCHVVHDVTILLS